MKKALIAAGALGVLVAGAAMANGMHHGRMGMMKHMLTARIEKAEAYVDATPAQKATIDQARDEILKAFEARAQANQGHEKLVEMLTADNLDTNKLYALADQRANDIRDMAKVIVPQIQKIHDALTPAQRQKLAAFVKEHHGKRGDRGQGGFGGPQE